MMLWKKGNSRGRKQEKQSPETKYVWHVSGIVRKPVDWSGRNKKKFKNSLRLRYRPSKWESGETDVAGPSPATSKGQATKGMQVTQLTTPRAHNMNRWDNRVEKFETTLTVGTNRW